MSISVTWVASLDLTTATSVSSSKWTTHIFVYWPEVTSCHGPADSMFHSAFKMDRLSLLSGTELRRYGVWEFSSLRRDADEWTVLPNFICLECFRAIKKPHRCAQPWPTLTKLTGNWPCNVSRTRHSSQSGPLSEMRLAAQRSPLFRQSSRLTCH